MRGDLDIQHEVLEELEWEASLDATGIGVAVRDGVVTLTGSMSDLASKLTAERAVKRIAGVRGIANELEVTRKGHATLTDAEIARAALQTLDWDCRVPVEHLQVIVEHGWLTLEGEVDWRFQKEAAEDALRVVPGVRGIRNRIGVRSTPTALDLRERIVAALHRSSAVDDRDVTVNTSDHTVILEGRVPTMRAREEVERLAWGGPGVSRVENRIVVEPYRG